MRRRRFSLLASLLFLSAVLQLDASELTDNEKVEARAISIDDVRGMIGGAPSAVPNVAPGKRRNDLEAAVNDLRTLALGLLEPMQQFDALRGRYGRLDDLGPVEPKRDELRRLLLDGHRRFAEQNEKFESIKKEMEALELQRLLSGGLKSLQRGKISDVGAILQFTDGMKAFRMKLDCLLFDDEWAYQERRSALENLRERRKMLWICGVAALILLLAGGGAAWVFRRRSPSPPSTGIGSVVGGTYQLERELGRGGMGLVFEATDLSLRRKVAIKQLRPEIRRNAKDLAQFLDEARLVAALKHPNIVEIYTVITERDEVYLVFELVGGRPLDLMLQQAGRLQFGAACALARQVCSALDFAHANKVIHRDLKPANVMVSPQGAAKVMDFGLAHQAAVTVAKLTRADKAGTPPYMAPEQELGEVSRESDLFALAVLFYEAVTGRLPFPGPNFLAQKREMFFTPPSAAAPDLPQGLDGVFARALQADPKLRFHSASEFAQALDSLVPIAG